MRLRVRVAGLVAASVAATVGLVTGVAAWSAERELFDPVDERLAERLTVMQSIAREVDGGVRSRPLVVVQGRDRIAGDRSLGPGPLLVILNDEPVDLGTAELPIDVHAAVDVAAAEGADSIGEVLLFDYWIDGQHHRIGRISLGDAVAYLGQDVSGLDDSLSSLRQLLLLIGLAGVGVAAGLGWLVARRIARPVVAVAEAAEALAANTGPPEHIEVRRTDEIGDLAETFNRLVDALETSRAQQSRLVADASHELRTPLTSLRLRIETLGEHPEMKPEHREQLIGSAVRELAALGALVEELVDLATDVEHVEEPSIPTSVGQIVEECVEAARVRCGRNIVVDSDDAVLSVSPRLYARAVANLVDNAVKYSPPDTTVRVVQSGAEVEVFDEGPGVSDDERPYVFDRFYRSSSAQSLPGSGIGLAIVQHVAETHGGDVWFEPTPSGGSRVGFRVTH